MSRLATLQSDLAGRESNAQVCDDLLALEPDDVDTKEDDACVDELMIAETPAEQANLHATSQDDHNSPATMTSPLLSLPAELRNHIYEYALIEPIPINIRLSRRQRLQDGTTALKSHNTAQQPALTRTCRQIRNESLELYYSANMFVVISRFWKPFCPLACWLERIGAQNRKAMSRLVIWCLRSEETLSQLFVTMGRDLELKRMELEWRWNGKVKVPGERPGQQFFEVLIEG